GAGRAAAAVRRRAGPRRCEGRRQRSQRAARAVRGAAVPLHDRAGSRCGPGSRGHLERAVRGRARRARGRVRGTGQAVDVQDRARRGGRRRRAEAGVGERRSIASHLETCPVCTDFAEQLERRPEELRELFPPPAEPLVAELLPPLPPRTTPAAAAPVPEKPPRRAGRRLAPLPVAVILLLVGAGVAVALILSSGGGGGESSSTSALRAGGTGAAAKP